MNETFLGTVRNTMKFALPVNLDQIKSDWQTSLTERNYLYWSRQIRRLQISLYSDLILLVGPKAYKDDELSKNLVKT